MVHPTTFNLQSVSQNHNAVERGCLCIRYRMHTSMVWESPEGSQDTTLARLLWRQGKTRIWDCDPFKSVPSLFSGKRMKTINSYIALCPWSDSRTWQGRQGRVQPLSHLWADNQSPVHLWGCEASTLCPWSSPASSRLQKGLDNVSI